MGKLKYFELIIEYSANVTVKKLVDIIVDTINKINFPGQCVRASLENYKSCKTQCFMFINDKNMYCFDLIDSPPKGYHTFYKEILDRRITEDGKLMSCFMLTKWLN